MRLVFRETQDLVFLVVEQGGTQQVVCLVLLDSPYSVRHLLFHNWLGELSDVPESDVLVITAGKEETIFPLGDVTCPHSESPSIAQSRVTLRTDGVIDELAVVSSRQDR